MEKTVFSVIDTKAVSHCRYNPREGLHNYGKAYESRLLLRCIHSALEGCGELTANFLSGNSLEIGLC